MSTYAIADAIDKFARHKGGLPMHMKTFLVILAALEPQEAALSEYEDYVEEVVAAPEFATCNTELKQEIIELKERRDSINGFNATDFLADLLKGVVWDEE